MNQSFLVIGTGEVGVSMLQALYNYQGTHQSIIKIAALVQPSTSRIQDYKGNVILEQTILEQMDLVNNSITELANVFSKYDTIICCSGFSIGSGMQIKITKAVLEAGVSRYVP
ncbi:Rossmann-fold NAD(P)-binding domain-containing protein [Flavobacterium algicola]|uniref:hypothetical protein n=1 Tax=Flavobacterium algicola TaxID=556529 RepID=UPI001EFD724A|nr:hypothetical protein [Flavobacterium algicola]MCG9793763.1 hypothetical protein [Flavobacterium algicola]